MNNGSNAKLANPIVSNPVNAAVEALKSGVDIEKAVYGTQNQIKPEIATPDDSFNTDAFMEGASGNAEEEGSEVIEESSEGAAKDPAQTTLEELTSSSASETKKKPSNILEVQLDKGKRTVKVDLNDVEAIKKYVAAADGMRKFQAERDQATKRLKEVEPKFSELEKTWTSLEKTWKNGGIEGLVNLLEGKPDAYKKHLQAQYEKTRKREEASPSELERMDLEDQLFKERAEKVRQKQEMDEFLKKASDKEASIEYSKLESLVQAPFEKYRFSSKLGKGKEALEHQMDEAVWTQTIKRLEAVDDSVELTPAMVDKEFRIVANTFRQLIEGESEKKVNKVIEQKKAAAQDAVAKTTSKGYKANSDADKFRADMRKGDLTNALSSLLTGKFKF